MPHNEELGIDKVVVKSDPSHPPKWQDDAVACSVASLELPNSPSAPFSFRVVKLFVGAAPQHHTNEDKKIHIDHHEGGYSRP